MCFGRPIGSACASRAATRSRFAAGSSATAASRWPSSTTSGRLEPGSFDPVEFLPAAYRSVEELEGFLEHLTREVHDPGLRAVVERLILSGPAAAEFRRAPCTRAGHHAYLGGLLEHTVSVGTLVGELCQLHPRLDSDLLMAAALLHDVGKTREFTYGAQFGTSEEGRLLGHLAIGAQMIAAAATGLAEQRRLALLHCVLSHHGPTPARGGLARAAARGSRLRLRRGPRPLPAERARRVGQGRPRARPLIAPGRLAGARRQRAPDELSRDHQGERGEQELEGALRDRVRGDHADRHPER